jgi:adenylate cyclase
MDTEPWEAAGLYDPNASGADERLALLEYLSIRGATLDQMMEAHRLGSLPAVAGDLVMERAPASLSIDEAARLSGVTAERLQRVLLALGLPVAGSDYLPEDTAGLMHAFEQGVALMGEDAIVAFIRVLGAATTNIAEAAVALFYTELGPGTQRGGADELARAKTSERATLAFATVPEVVHRVLQTQFDRAVRRSAIARGGSTPTRGQGEKGDSGPGEVIALGFVDLVGSTAWAETLSLRDHSLALSRFESAAWSSAVGASGRVIKMIGDEVFFAAPSVDSACQIGTEVCRAVATDPVLPPARGAIGYGLVASREGDYFGPLVNLIARLVKTALPGDLLATEEAADALVGNRWTMDELEPQSVRGHDSPVRVFVVHESDEDSD